MDVVVTGAAGFLGRRLVSYLNGKGHRTIPMLMDHEISDGLKNVIRGDITDPKSISFPECEAVIHCAGILESSHPTNEVMLKVNLDGTKNVFEEGSSKGMKRFIFISTISALGPCGSKKAPMSEEMEPRPSDIYGRSKLEAERYIETISENLKISATVLRPSVLYGPGMNLNSSGMKTFTSINKGIMPLVGDGSTTLNMLYVDNLIHAINIALNRTGNFRIYHVSERPYTQKNVIHAIERRMGKKGHKRYPKPILWLLTFGSEVASPFLKGPPPLSWTKYHGLTKDLWTMSSERIRSELGYTEVKTLEEGIDETCSHYGW